jgi:hypothetical protein
VKCPVTQSVLPTQSVLFTRTLEYHKSSLLGGLTALPERVEYGSAVPRTGGCAGVTFAGFSCGMS